MRKPRRAVFFGIQNSDSDFQDSESESYFLLFLSRGYLYHVTITYRLAAGTIEYDWQIIEEVY